MHALNSIVDAIERVERVLCAFTVALFCFTLSVNVILRYALNSPLYYAEEVSVILMIWMAFVASSLAIGNREMVAVMLIPELMSPSWQRRLALLSQIIVLITSVVFLYWSIVWMLSPSALRDIIITLGLPKWPAYVIVPAFFALAILKSMRNLGVVARTPVP